MTKAEISNLIYRHTGLRAEIAGDAYVEVFRLCQAVEEAAKDESAQRIAELEKEAARQVEKFDQLRSNIKEMQEAVYTFGDYSKEAVRIALDGVLDAIDELAALAAAPSGAQEAAKPTEREMRWAKYLARQTAIEDHACRECVPHGSAVKEGFQCVKHEAAAMLHPPYKC